MLGHEDDTGKEAYAGCNEGVGGITGKLPQKQRMQQLPRFQLMNCIFCHNPITDRRKGDHIIPQGLGKFLPDYTVFHICKACDAKNGNRFERIALRTGFLAFFRSIKGIKSKNNKGLPIHSPSLDKFSAIESQEFAIVNTSKPNETVYVAGDGKIRYANRILIKENGVLINSIEIPPTRDISEICNFIETNIPKRLNGLEYELNICEIQMDEISKEFSRRGKKLGELYQNKQEPELSTHKISSTFTDNHFRFIASTVLKGMIFLGYSTDLLRYMIEYVKTGDTANLFYRFIDEKESGIDAFEDPPLKLFYHAFEWNVTETAIAITASILAHKNVNGIRMKLSLKTGNDSSIIIPYGKIIARYGDTPSDGIIEIFHGDHKLEK